MVLLTLQFQVWMHFMTGQPTTWISLIFKSKSKPNVGFAHIPTRHASNYLIRIAVECGVMTSNCVVKNSQNDYGSTTRNRHVCTVCIAAQRYGNIKCQTPLYWHCANNFTNNGENFATYQHLGTLRCWALALVGDCLLVFIPSWSVTSHPPMSTQPSPLCRKVKWVPAFRLSNSNKCEGGLQAEDSQLKLAWS